MEGKPSNKECVECNHIYPVSFMEKITRKIKTGKSGRSYSVNKRGSARVFSGRNYYRFKDVWVCNNCNNTSLGKLVLIIIAIAFIVLIKG